MEPGLPWSSYLLPAYLLPVYLFALRFNAPMHAGQAGNQFANYDN